MKINFDNKIVCLLFFSLILHIFSAIFSSGFYKHDEHFSILEPIMYKIGETATITNDFYELKDRSWFLTYIFYLFTKFFYLLGFSSPFKVAFLIRLFTSLIGWLSIIAIIILSKKIFKKKSTLIFVGFCSSFLWFYPYLHARTSSENISSSLLIIGITIFLVKNNNTFFKWQFVLSGILLGMVFLSRYTMGFSILFFGLWALFINKNKFYELFLTFLGIFITIFIGILIDFWGYEKISIGSLSIINYFHQHTFGAKLNHEKVLPIWYYFYILVKDFLPPISIFIIVSILFFWFKNFTNFVTWVTLPLFIFLSLMGHKELRYLFPIIMFSPIFMGFIIEYINLNYKKFCSRIFTNFLFKFIISLTIIINFIALIFLTFSPAYKSMPLFKFLYNNEYNISKIYALDNIPYIKTGLLINLYRNKNISFTKLYHLNNCPTVNKEINTNNEFSARKFTSVSIGPQLNKKNINKLDFTFDYNIICDDDIIDNYHLLLKNKFILFSKVIHLQTHNVLAENNCKIIYQSIPNWLKYLNYNNWLNRINKWYLIKC